jgi:hypothetical protein
MKARIQRVRKEYATELLVALVVLSGVVGYAYFGSMMLNQ